MNSLKLALRVLRVDRRTRTSAILTAVGVAVATGLVLLLAALPFATQVREQRGIWQSYYNFDTDGTPVMLVTGSKDYFNGQEITRVDLAVTGSTAGLKLPAGISKLPGPGETLVSPALGRLLNNTPANQLGDRFGKPVAALGDQALKYPEQLVALVGHSQQELTATEAERATEAVAQPVSAFPDQQAKADPLLTLLAWVGIIVLLVPSLVLVASSARLTAARRERRLAAIRLAGATPGQVTSMVAGETILSAGVGALLGLGISPALHGLATFVPWGGGTWLASDFTMPIALEVFIVIAIPALVVLAGVLGLRRVLRNPLFATGGHTVKPLRWWRLLVLPVAGLFFLYAVSSAGDGGPSMVLIGLVLLVGSAVVVGPWVTSAVGGTFVRGWRGPSALLAGRRLRDDPKGAYRATAGIVLAVFTGSMALTLLPSFESLAGGGRTYADSVLYADSSPDKAAAVLDHANAALARYGQQERAISVGQVYLVQGTGEQRSYQRALVMSCADAARLTRLGITAADCKPGVGLYTPYEQDAAQYRVVGDPEPSDPGQPLGAVPTGTFRMADDVSGSYLLDPSAVPAGVKLGAATVIAPTTPADREIVRTALASAATGAEVGSRDQYLYDQQTQLQDLRRVTVIGLIAAGVLAGCSAAVATAGSIMDRRRTFGALMAAGTPVKVLSRALRMETALPALVATIGAGVVGILVGIGLFSTADEGSVVFSPWIFAPVVLGVGVALLGASICTPALRRVQAEPLADE
ncbi:ABC transporter permease [Amycolatopsis rhabdoformis]|uniref:ABC transporter permease n=1 Tax=Amycolatopsis rhabdoformis TaxID=1448059 RepID=A0ABZ1I1N6_9PSEU|nr:ABC transporter permease [Amycolatopsis rhabdoformis]WSE28289.1 ABC transporter permease [Amycolatopsis rhabdoformis]